MTPLYRMGDTQPPGNNIAFLQVGVPTYRISQMVANGGTIVDAYGYVNVISPSGLPIRAIVGIRPDPIMLVAINCVNVEESKSFYQDQLGFTEQTYPYARPSNGTGPFEPLQPKGSVYMAPSPNCMGVLLLPLTKKKQTIVPNPVLDSLQIVYAPSSSSGAASSSSDANDKIMPSVIDPSNVKINFVKVSDFEQEERQTR